MCARVLEAFEAGPRTEACAKRPQDERNILGPTSEAQELSTPVERSIVEGRSVTARLIPHRAPKNYRKHEGLSRPPWFPRPEKFDTLWQMVLMEALFRLREETTPCLTLG